MRLGSSSNFRQVGAEAGVPLQHLFRSDHLGALDEGDAAQIRALGVSRVLDFRGAQERTAAACRLPKVSVHSLPIEPTIVQKLTDLVAAGHSLSGGDVSSHMEDTYRGFVRHNTPRFAEFFAHLLASNEPTVFHCTAGKDRTGMTAALLLSVLGVDDETVLDDYELSTIHWSEHRIALLRPSFERAGIDIERFRPLFVAPRLAMSSLLTALRDTHGGAERYLVDAGGMDPGAIEELRRLLVQPA
jgi:protein-tyrosine phosphatase